MNSKSIYERLVEPLSEISGQLGLEFVQEPAMNCYLIYIHSNWLTGGRRKTPIAVLDPVYFKLYHRAELITHTRYLPFISICDAKFEYADNLDLDIFKAVATKLVKRVDRIEQVLNRYAISSAHDTLESLIDNQ